MPPEHLIDLADADATLRAAFVQTPVSMVVHDAAGSPSPRAELRPSGMRRVD